MKFQRKILVFFVIFILHYASGCFYSDANKRFQCETPAEISVEGTAEWNNTLLYTTKRVVLKPNSFKRTPNLIELSLASLSAIEPGSLNGLPKLDKLVLFETDLQEIPDAVINNLPIRSLQIFNNKLFNKLEPGFFAEVPDIRIVDIRRNNINKIKIGVFNNTPIYKLYLDFNGINSIDDNAFSNMDNLVLLSLTGNLIKSFTSRQYIGENNLLTHLYLNKNMLTKITKETFDTTTSLQKLFLEVNQIDHIEDGTFNKLSDLDLLDLSNNLLTELQPKLFPVTGMKKLYYFFVHNNKLTFINPALLLRAPEVHYITYGGNPFQCPCIDIIKEWTGRMKIIRLCDDVYTSGDRPICIYSEIAPKDCIFDVELTQDLYNIYMEALVEYPKLELKCVTSMGINNTALGSTF